MNNATSFEWSADSPLEIAAALLLSAVFLYSVVAAWQRLGRHARARWSAVTVLNAMACLAIFALLAPPEMLRPASDAVILVTEGAPSGPEAVARAYVAPNAGDFGRGPAYLLDAGQLRLREPAVGTLTITGFGLDAPQWQHLPDDLVVHFDPPPLGGLVETAWSRSLLQGEALVVTGRYLDDGTTNATTIELLDPAGVVVAEHTLLSGDAFELVTYPKASGLLDYRLRVVGNEAELQVEPVPVHLRPGESPVLYVFQSAPSFETRQIQNWAGDHGTTVLTDTVITRGRELQQRINADSLADESLSPALLGTIGLTIIDGRAWASLDAGRRAWFGNAVREGMGLLILADGDLADYIGNGDALLQGFSLADQERDQDGYVPLWPGSMSEQPLPVIGMMLGYEEGTELTRIKTGEVVEAYRNVGLGRVAISVLRERHRWLTAGDEATYTAYWARLLGVLGRPRMLPYLLRPANDSWPRPQRRTRVCAMTGDADLSFEVAPLQGVPVLDLPDAAPATGGPQRCAAFWPQQPGWHRVSLLNDETVESQNDAFFYVFGDDQWRSAARYARQQATLARASTDAARQAGMTRTARVEIGLLWPWLVFIISAGLLWLERRLYD